MIREGERQKEMSGTMGRHNISALVVAVTVPVCYRWFYNIFQQPWS